MIGTSATHCQMENEIILRSTNIKKVSYISIVTYFVFICTLTEFHSCKILFPSTRTNILDEVTQNP